MSQTVLLVSPAPVDGYPPVQYQARLLAEAGYRVRLLTSDLRAGHPPEFEHPGVDVVRLPLNDTSRVKRLVAKLTFAWHLWRWRRAAPAAAEIAYDPFGLVVARRVPGRTGRLIVQLHEMLIDPATRREERFVVRHLREADLVVVPDAERARILQKQTGLAGRPMVVRNLPLLADAAKPSAGAPNPFSVVYHGSIGSDQALDAVIRSISTWPDGVALHIYGNPTAPFRETFTAIAEEEGVAGRLYFDGWVPRDRLVETLRRHSLGLSFLRPVHDQWRYAAGASNKRYQYMQAGLPQLSDRNPGVEALIDGNRVGRCLDPDVPGAIGEAVRFYHDHPDVVREDGARALHLHRNELYYEREFEPVLAYLRGLSLSPVRLLLVDPSGELYGSEKVLLDLLAHLDRAAFDVTVACPPDGPLWGVLAQRGERTLPLAAPGRGALRSILALRKAIVAARPDVIHLNQAGTHKHVMVALAGRPVPVLVHVRLAEDAAHVQTPLARRLAPAGFIAISHYIRSLLSPDAPAATVYDAFDAEVWTADIEPAGLRARLGVPEQTRIVLFVGRVCYDKGVDSLVEAAEQLYGRGDVHVLIVGGTPAAPEHEAFAASMLRAVEQAGHRVTFFGAQADIASLMAESDILAAPSRMEALGRVLFEALALGVPVVASAVGGMCEVVGEDARGWAVPPNNPDALATALLDALDRPDEARRRTAAGSAWVRRHCDPRDHARSIEDAYRQALARSHRSSATPLAASLPTS